MMHMMRLVIAMLILLPSLANAWWNADWKQRQKVDLKTTAEGIETRQPLTGITIAVRLHGGNFTFGESKPDGSDLRFVSGDDKTLLKHHVERFEAANELAVVWVRIPTLAPGAATQSIWLYHGNPKAPDAADAKGTFEGSGIVLNFSDADGSVRDVAGSGVELKQKPAGIDPAGILGASGTLSGQPIVLAESPALQSAGGGMLSVSMWLKIASAEAKAVVYRQGPLELGLEAGSLVLRNGRNAVTKGGQVKTEAWQHVAFVFDGQRATVYLDGQEVAAAETKLPELTGAVSIGDGIRGGVDALQISPTARSADWVKVSARGQGIDTSFAQVVSEDKGGESGGGHSYFGILIDNLTVDAWVVIAILAVMFVIAVVVMISKGGFIAKTDAANRRFLKRFREANEDFINIESQPEFKSSSLFRLYEAGQRELRRRVVGGSVGSASVALSGASVDAIKAAIDADVVREGHRLNSQMVMLTIAISGGPFLGLLGTVVGVMITFAAIAAAGDVNVNAIAPGIASALLATVAGLAVAIPALFGYNYLATRIKNISADMQIFVDEFVTRIAERYAAP